MIKCRTEQRESEQVRDWSITSRMGRTGIWVFIMGSLEEINQDAQANGGRASTLPDGDPSRSRQSRRCTNLISFFVATQVGRAPRDLLQGDGLPTI
jgi:hypothetical protein